MKFMFTRISWWNHSFHASYPDVFFFYFIFIFLSKAAADEKQKLARASAPVSRWCLWKLFWMWLVVTICSLSCGHVSDEDDEITSGLNLLRLLFLFLFLACACWDTSLIWATSPSWPFHLISIGAAMRNAEFSSSYQRCTSLIICTGINVLV